MTAKWEKTEANVGVLEVEVEKQQLTDALDWAFKKVVKGVTIPGFRKGKVPRKIFESRFGVESLYQDALDYLLPKAYEQAVEEAGIIPVAQPSVDVVQMQVGEPLVFKATVTVKPEVKLGDYKGLELQDKEFPVDDEMVQKEIDRIRSEHAEINPVEDGKVENGDTVNIDFKGTIKGEPFEGGEAENFHLEVGSGTFIAGFEEKLIGMAPQEERDVDVTFPEDYHVKSLAGQQAEFHVKLHDIKRRFLREMNDEFVQEISDFETVEAYIEDLKKQLIDRQAHEHEQYLENEAVKLAVESCIIDIPDVMIEHEADHRVEDFARQLQYQQIPFDAYLEFTGATKEELRNQYRESAEQTVRTQLALEAIAEAEGLQVTDEELDAELQRLAESANITVERAKEIMNLRDPGLNRMRVDLRWRKTVEFLVAHSKVA